MNTSTHISPANSNEGLSTSVHPIPTDLLLIVFIHGFKGTDETFGSFPEWLQHFLSGVIKDSIVECVVLPSYETRGDLKEAVERFADWLTTLTVERENSNGTGGGAGKAKIVLCGHSMGGLLAADSLLSFVRSRPHPSTPLWPRIIACLTFDTPFLGVHPFVFKNSVTEAVEHVNTARSAVSSVFSAFSGLSVRQTASTTQRPLPAPESISPASQSKWRSAAIVAGGALLVGAASMTAYQKSEELTTGLGWVKHHLTFVSQLWDEKALSTRVNDLIQVEKELTLPFRNFYIRLPPSPPKYSNPRTFIILPSQSSPAFGRFLPTGNTLANGEIEAHMNMFNPATNDHYHALGLEAANFIQEADMIARGIPEASEAAPSGATSI